jgi:ankyrin repeat protein
MWRAALYGNVDKVKELLATSPLGATVAANERIGECQSTPLHAAVCNNSVAVARVLLENGASIIAKKKDGCSPLHSACKRGIEWLQFVDLLVYHHKTSHIDSDFLEIRDNHGDTPLHMAVRFSLGIPRLLISYGADVSARNLDGNTPLHGCMSQSDHMTAIPTALLLLQHGAFVNARNDTVGETVLHVVMQRNPPRFVFQRMCLDVLLRNGSDVNIPTFAGETALHKLVGSVPPNFPVLSVIERLFSAGVDVDRRTVDGLTAEDTAMRVGNTIAAAVIRDESRRIARIEARQAFALGGLHRGAGQHSRVRLLDPGVVDLILEKLEAFNF